VKIAFVGDSGCGKSSLINYSLDNEEVLDYDGETNLVDIKFKEVKLNNNSIVNFGMWDFSGKQDSIRIRTELYQEFQAIAYCFDLSNKTSYNNIESFWMKEVDKYGGSKLKPVCLGLKSDLTKVVDFGTVSNFCKAHKMNYFEISIKDVSSVKRFFYEFGGVLFDLIKGKK
jgi:small GTP-binding protein